MRSKSTDKPLHLEIELPEDGTISPRIVAPGISLWLKPDARVELSEDGLVAENKNGRCILSKSEDTREILVNGQELAGIRDLKDGDFIHGDGVRAIFQADPVADYRKEWRLYEPEDLQITLRPSDQLSKFVRMDKTTISLDGGKTVTKWEDVWLLALRLGGYNSSRWSAQIVTSAGHDLEFVDSKFRKPNLKWKDVEILRIWANYSAPFHLSIRRPSYGGVEPDDAYTVLAHLKIKIPFETRQRILPATLSYIFDLPSQKRLFWGIVARIIVSAWAAFIIAGTLNVLFGISMGGFFICFAAIVLWQNKSIRDSMALYRKLPEYSSTVV